MLTLPAKANSCESQLFTATLNSALTIADVIENLADECGLTLIVKDNEAKKRLSEKLYYVELNNASLDEFLDIILVENDISYLLEDSRLKISYLNTQTFKLHYIAGDRKGTSNAHVTIANSGKGGSSGGDSGSSSTGSKTGVSIESSDDFQFWSKIEKEIHALINRPEDSYTAPTPIINPEAGMITVTGTNDQLARVSKYLQSLTRQIKRQVLIDVKILGVVFNNSKTTGVDWNQIYKLQNFQVDSLLMSQKNVSGFLFDKNDGITETTFREGAKPKNGGVINITGSVAVDQIVKFLSTQGDVKAISSPRIMTLNNQPALISVGQEIFYKIKSTSSLGQNSSGTAEGEVVDSVFAGILLDITPQISKNGMVTLRINPSITDTVDDVSTEAIRSIPPDLRKRQISSVVTIKDGSHAILGGLITTSTGEIVTKVPLLGDMPLIEHAFKKTEKIEKVEELVFIITPHIIKNEKTLNLKDLGYTKL